MKRRIDHGDKGEKAKEKEAPPFFENFVFDSFEPLNKARVFSSFFLPIL
jgi:hypothetical protein